MRLLTLLALVAAASASTPPGYSPSNTDDNLVMLFGSTKAEKGTNIPRADTASAPTLYTTTILATGRYSLLLSDPDASNGHLHWLQPLLPNDTKTSNGYPLSLTSAGSVTVSYQQPSPPYSIPYTHRYVALLLNLTDITGVGDESLSAMTVDRSPFDAAAVVKAAGVPVVGSGWFNVTNEQALSSSSAAGGSSTTMASSTVGTTSVHTTSGSSSATSAPPSPSINAAAAALTRGWRAEAGLVLGAGVVVLGGLL